MTPPQIGRELLRARGDELRRHGERQDLVRVARSRATAEAAPAARSPRWVVRLVHATLRL